VIITGLNPDSSSFHSLEEKDRHERPILPAPKMTIFLLFILFCICNLLQVARSDPINFFPFLAGVYGSVFHETGIVEIDPGIKMVSQRATGS
jgi:hypothetical protein